LKNIRKSSDEKIKYPSLSETIAINERVRKQYVPFDLDGGINNNIC